MEKLVAVLLLVSAVGARAASFPFILNYVLHIDCGLTGETTEHYNNQTWFPDSFFMDTGKTKQINSETHHNVSDQVMTTLRYFPNGEAKNCYRLPLVNTEKFIFRAGFYYGNYDGKSQPPVFDLSLGGQPWATVNSSAMDGPVFHELLYAPRNDNLSVCLVGRKEYGHTPFISSLEATYLDEDDTDNRTVYGMMRNGTAYHLVARLNFGGHDQVIEPWSGMADVCEERLNRYWTPQPMPGYTNLTFAATSCSGTAYENRPPNSVINTAISPATNASQSIYVPVNLPTNTPQSAYIVLYFYQNRIVDGSPENLNATRNMDVYIDGFMRRNVKLQGFRSGEVVTLYPVLVQDTVNVTISPANGTVLPPLLNGMEVFYATELAEEAGSSNGAIKISCSVIVVGICQLIVSVFLGLI
ncbi:UNVERIFIED_CONTAM: putative LRR receptor-like serine/threonine-protein kinase [Sesamum radiatum]|uniref:LRR receptor-like serine/threonine-protein kinase n=1 Tax=Sesamum radiatum TaxID=300843 RepID=A0AAW2PZ07_SESRA